MADPNEFKVVDKRHTARESSNEKGERSKDRETRGEGFVAKDAPTAGPADVDFSTFILSLATSALICLGVAPDPTTKKVQKNLLVAKQNIDILGMIREKTRGNLTQDEAKLMDSLLTEVRLRFVEASK